MPPVAAGLATFIAPKLFTRQEKEAASSAIVVGATVATEPAIPYALAAPLPMITANTLAGGITGVLVIAFGIKRLAPGLGIFDPLIGLMSPVGSFYLVLAIGLAEHFIHYRPERIVVTPQSESRATGACP